MHPLYPGQYLFHALGTAGDRRATTPTDSSYHPSPPRGSSLYYPLLHQYLRVHNTAYVPYQHTYPTYHPAVAAVRPDIACTFSAMRRCDGVFGNGATEADVCREGARDAHLLDHTHVHASHPTHGSAYVAGQSYALACPPSLDVSYPHAHGTACADPRTWPPCHQPVVWR